MIWRFTYDALRWIWPAIFAGVFAVVTAALAASAIWPGAKTWTSHAFSWAVAIGENPVAWIVGFAIFVFWLVGFLWCGSKVHSGTGTKKKQVEDAQKLSERLRAIKGTDPVPHLAHVEFLADAQRAKAQRLNDAIISAGWETNPGTVAATNLQRHIEGIEVSGFNMGLVEKVTTALDKAGFGPTSKFQKPLGFGSSNPKWERAQRTVYLLIGFPPE